MNRGVLYALCAYVFWGLHPIYWKLLKNVPSTEIVAHRIFWSLIFFTVIISFRKNWKSLVSKIKESKYKSILVLPAFLIGSNWGMYIWAVNAGFIIETSLGYFISPLVSVFLGVIFLHEKLKKIQWLAIALALTGVLVMTLFYGQFPWISIYLAGTWGLYGLLRKKSPLGPVEGLTFETLILSVPALIYLATLTNNSSASFATDLPTTLLLIGAGITSGLPLMVFISGARLINLSLIGVLQYIYPTLIFIVGYLGYHEELTEAKLIGFIFIWCAVILYSASLLNKKQIT